MMIDLKNTKDTKREKLEEAAVIDDAKYPWGLNVTLNAETLKKLGVTVDDFTIGGEITVPVVMKVTDLNKHANERAESESVGLVITQMEAPSKPKKTDKERATSIFGE